VPKFEKGNTAGKGRTPGSVNAVTAGLASYRGGCCRAESIDASSNSDWNPASLRLRWSPCFGTTLTVARPSSRPSFRLRLRNRHPPRRCEVWL
jgi:hypothetical protein